MNNLKIRFVKESDVKSIFSIYKLYIENTTITFECITPSLIDLKKRIEKVSSFYPYIVCEIENKIIGYAYASRVREREAYQWDAELSIYIDKEYLHFGIGKILYKALLDLLKEQNIYNVYGVITQPNLVSEKLHESLGFTKIGVFHNTGNKFNKWLDVVWYEKSLSEFSPIPKVLKSIKEVENTAIINIFNKYINELNNLKLNIIK